MAQDAELTWGEIQFHGPVLPETGYAFQAVSGGTNFGNPEALWEIAKSLLSDGSLAVLQGWDNREVPIHLCISAPNDVAGPALAEAERVLMLALQAKQLAPLRWTPPAQDAATSVFDVVAARLDRDHTDWDFEETTRERRHYLLTLTCLPFARGENTVVVPALAPAPPTPTVVDIDDCTSTSAWTYNANRFNMAGSPPALNATGGSINSSGTVSKFGGSTGAAFYEVERLGSIPFTTTPYLRVTATLTGGAVSFDIANIGLPIMTAASTAVPGATDYYFKPSATSLSSLRTRAITAASPANGTALGMKVHHLARTDTLPGSGTTRQLSRSAIVGGSAPTQASIRLYDATPAALGTEIMVYSSQNLAWQPPLRPWVALAGAVTGDSARVSGGRNTLATPMVFEFPASLLEEATYALMALMNVSVAGEVGWSVRMVNSSGGTTIGSSVVLSGSTPVAVTSGYRVINVASLPLPVVAVEGDQMIELTLTGTANMIVDDAEIFDLTNGALTWIKDADSLRWIDIRSPELGADRPHVYGGTGAFGTNPACIDWKCESFGAHRFAPGPIQIWTMTSTSLVSQSEIEHYERSHTHVEGDDAA